MEDKDDDQALPTNTTEESSHDKEDNDNEDDDDDSFIYFKSSSIISILIIVVISLVCVLATGLLIRRILHAHNITRTLSVYLGFTPNRTIDESKLTFWAPKSIYDEQPIEILTAMINSSTSQRPPPPPIILTSTEKKAQTIFRTIILPILFLLSILCGILAFYMRRHHYHYPAWGARPKRPEQYVTIELKRAQTAGTNDHI
ncbi:unnamed protein product [Adineta steineri]|uniref:Uncharacterized protein n=1 Tax=Adineta steineri TaxID=433720 RepID=A0A819ENZ4_9BILA|nr:unnamed protein product [Adineta steineri]CAF3852590.1 unnamed protein product [Adineta steineri]